MRQRVVVSAIWDEPFFRNSRGIARQVLGVEQVARQCGVAVDTARRWARTTPTGVEPAREAGGAA